jgi:hypothetical protein
MERIAENCGFDKKKFNFLNFSYHLWSGRRKIVF